MKKQIIVGEYNRYGYRIWDAKGSMSNGYSAGNHRRGSVETAIPGTVDALSLRELRVACIQTALDIVAEQGAGYGAVYGGVERAEDDT